jgi:uncharacterized zinc-type alcohol dehydrogenase-like protein
LKKLAGSLDFIVVTANAKLDWDSIISLLKHGGRLHIVGAVLEPIPVHAMALIMGKKSVSGSPAGNRIQTDQMLRFAAQHKIAPQVEYFPMSKVNEAMEHLKSGKARYRIVLNADFN